MFEPGKDVDILASTSLLRSERSDYGTAPERTPASHPSDGDDDAQADAIVITEELSTTQLAIVLGSTYLGIILAALDGTMVATLTASISASYNSLTLLAWLASAYYIANSILQPLAGKLTDIYGRRAGLVLCNILFCAGNLICGLARSESVIIFGRVVAGLGGGGLNAIPLFITNDLVPLRRRGVWQGINNICFGVGSGLGGIYGGWLNDTIGWRAAFLILVPLTLLSCVLVAIFVRMPTTEVKDVEEKWRRVDVLGSLVLVSAIILLLVGLNSGGNTVPWNHPLVLASLPISLVLFAGFAYVETNLAIEPIIPVKLLLNQTVLAACLTSWFFSMAQLALTFYAPIFFQIQGKSAKMAGILLIPTSVGAAVGGIASGMIIRASGKYYLLNLVVQITFLLPLGLATRFDLHTPVILPVIYFFFTGLSYAGKLTITVTALIAAVQQKHQAVITSASYACRGTGSAIGIAVCSLVFQNTLKRRLWEEFGGEDGAVSIIGRLRDNLKEIKYLPNDGWMAGAEDAYMDALTHVFWTIFGLAALGTVASLFMREHTLHKSLARRDSQ
ncbi:MAG: hypothetical protein L6R38_005180 [Xanthoria sp. 2 TBL-2021]|nr:MAG: hypothetical protein L6R38_005180 [Xanthoria sp. 2 TBL-2021]